MRFCIYTIGDQINGFGHVMREITLARELSERGAGVDFMTQDNTPGMLRLNETDFTVLSIESVILSIENTVTFPHALGKNYDAILVDVEHGPTRALLESLRPHFKTIVTVCGSGYKVSDPGAVQELSDLIIEQNPFGRDRHTAITETLTGIEYLLVDPRYADISGDRDGPIVLSMGAGDPHGVTQPIGNRLLTAGYPLRVVIGPAMGVPDFNAGPEPEIVNSPDNLLDVLDGARLLIGALGMTAFEAAAAGVPMLLTGWTGDHVRMAEYLESLGVAISLGPASHLRPEHVLPHVERLWYDADFWQVMHAAGPALVDGRGVERVAERLMNVERMMPGDGDEAEKAKHIRRKKGA